MDEIERALREYYEAESAMLGRPAQRERRRELALRSAARYADEEVECVLDVGAGPAVDHRPFVDAGLAYVGVDLAVGNATLAAEAGAALVPASLFALPFGDGTFESGWSMSTFQHVPDDRIDAALAEFVRVLAPGAPVTVGMWGGREEVLDADSSSTGIALPRHFTLRSHDRIRSILGRHLELDGGDASGDGSKIWIIDGSTWEYHVATGRAPSTRRTR